MLLDSDVAMLYGCETKQVNQAVSRNKDRFPENYRFRLTEEEYAFLEHLRCQNGASSVADTKQLHNAKASRYIENSRSRIVNSNMVDTMRSQNVTASKRNLRYLPYVFTEQGIAMLSGVIKNEIAVRISISIMDAFVDMRRFITTYGSAFERLTNVEYKMLEHDKKFDELFDLIQISNELNMGIFYKGQIYDAFKLIINIVQSANKTITIIDNYTDDSVLDMLTKKKTNVAATIVTSKPSRLSNLAISKFVAQHPGLKVLNSDEFHDRFIIVDNNKLYHIGASLKDAGKKCFAVSILDDDGILMSIMSLISKIA